MNTLAKRSLSITLSLLLVAAAPLQSASQQPSPAAPANSAQHAPLSATELQQIVAPIALYPDALVAQVLGAATRMAVARGKRPWLRKPLWMRLRPIQRSAFISHGTDHVGLTVSTEAAQSWAVDMSAPFSAIAIRPCSKLLFLAVSFAGCRTNKPALGTFATPDEAGNALLDAARSYDAAKLTTIFGPDSKDVISSGDTVQDKNTTATFARDYDAMHRWRKMTDGSEIVLVGYDNFPFPIPLRKNNERRWFFDTAAGKKEILNRRHGRNEMAIIDVCYALAKAQAQYFSQSHDGGKARQYAQKLISDPGKHNGLYWTPQPGEPKSPLGPLATFATAEGYTVRPDAHVPFHGYFFRMLQTQNGQVPGGAKTYVKAGQMTRGFALVAYPAEYGVSGIMSFMINQDGVLLQKDLGTNTASIRANMTEFSPDSKWKVVVQQQT